MIKRTLILSALIMLACEDKEEINPSGWHLEYDICRWRSVFKIK